MARHIPENEMTQDPDCIFCKIARGEVPSRKVYEDDDVFAFHDIRPQAPVHILIVPKRPYGSLMDVPPGAADSWRWWHLV